MPVDTRTWIRNVELPWKHKDPADRTIVATAEITGSALVTNDRAIRAYFEPVIW